MTRSPDLPNLPDAKRTSGMAITAMVLGILGVLTGCLAIGIVPALAGLVLGIVALMQIAKPDSGKSGKGFAIAGIATGAVGVLVSLVGVLVMVPALQAARDSAQQMQEASQLRQMAVAYMVYAVDHNDQVPTHAELLIDGGYVGPELFASPYHTAQPTPTSKNQLTVIDPPGSPVYRYGDYLWLRHSGPMNAIATPGSTPVAISAVPSPKTGRRVVLFMDGHVEIVDPANLSQVVGPMWAQVDLVALDADGP